MSAESFKYLSNQLKSIGRSLGYRLLIDMFVCDAYVLLSMCECFYLGISFS